MNSIERLAPALAGRYRIERELGAGGMATVYLAEDLKHGRRVAIKVLHPELSAVIGGERFLAEIKVTANLQHPHILGLIDSGEADGLLYYVMPYVSGESLRDRLGREKQLPVEDAVRLAREAAGRGVDAVAVAGGDGMIGLALQALAGTGTPLGVIPAGTGNDHARAYGLPLGDPEAAADVVADGHTADVDLGHATAADGTGRYFGSVLATGFDSLVSDRTNRLRWPRGRMRYNLAVLVEFARLRPLPFRIELADGTVVEHDLTLAAVGNTRSYGGGMRICPDADPADGLLDVTVVRAMPRLRVARFFPSVFSGTHVRHAEVETHRTASLRIGSPGITAYADGEPIGPLPVDVRVVPGALRLLVPARGPGPAPVR